MTSTAVENIVSHDRLTLVRLDRRYDSPPGGRGLTMMPPGENGNVFYATREEGPFGNTYGTIIVPVSDPRSAGMWNASREVYPAIPADGVEYRGWNVPRNLLTRVEPGEAVTEEPDVSLRNGEVVAEGTVNYDLQTPRLSFEKYRQRFRTVAYAGGHTNGVPIPPITTLLERMDCHRPTMLRQGMFWMPGDRDLFDLLQTGTTVEYGDPTSREDYVLVGIEGNTDWPTLAGALDYYGRVLTVVQGPEVFARTPHVASVEDAASIVEFKRQVWELGVRAKADQRWCPAYERSMFQSGIQHALTTLSVVTPEEAALLPVGSMLRPIAPVEPSLYVRDDNSTNPAGTRAIIGEGHWAPLMQVAYNPERGEMNTPAGSNEELEAMPIGTRILLDGYRYAKHDARTYREMTYGSMTLAIQMGTTPIYYTEVPGVTS